MREALAHRGPDGSGVEAIGNVGLVHTRLAIVDLSERARQPMRHPSGQWWISYNGEIYNHNAIRKELAGEPFSSRADTETLLYALARWGISSLPRLNGQFAFAALDLGRRRLLLARDRFGIKPLYVAKAEDGIWFASEPEAIFAAGISPSARPGSWPTLVDASCYRGEATLLSGLRRVLPGTCEEVSLDTLQCTVNTWSSLAGHLEETEQGRLCSLTRPELVDELHGTLRSAVHDALLGDVPIGTMCSGGVDSSLVTALATEVKSDMVAFGASYKGGAGPDEGPFARKVADSLGIEADIFEVTKPTWRGGFVAATLHFGEPLHNASSVAIAQIAERARRRGIKVLLTGEGADELFAGYLYHRSVPLRRFLSPGQGLLRDFELVLTDQPSHLAKDALARLKAFARLRWAPGWGSSPELQPYLKDAHPCEMGPAATDGAYASHPGPRKEVEVHLLSIFYQQLSHLLNRMDKNMMQASVEARVPFLDPRLVSFAMNLPLEARTLPWSKGILRDVARRHLPLSIAHRRKIYGMIFNAGEWVEEAAEPNFLANGMFRDLFSVPRRQFAELLASATGTERLRLWSAEVWCRSVFGRHRRETIERDLWPHGP
jgi:asparagine synthase (glutamine-hydrolysing)